MLMRPFHLVILALGLWCSQPSQGADAQAQPRATDNHIVPNAASSAETFRLARRRPLAITTLGSW